MARKLRLEIEGGLYHVITRDNDRQDIFHSKEDRQSSCLYSKLKSIGRRPPEFVAKGDKPIKPRVKAEGRTLG